MKIREFFKTMNCSMTLESSKLRYIDKDGCPITVRLNNKNYDKYVDKEIISWSFYLTRFDCRIPSKYLDICDYFIIEVENV